jgi:hypothetical protein
MMRAACIGSRRRTDVLDLSGLARQFCGGK